MIIKKNKVYFFLLTILVTMFTNIWNYKSFSGIDYKIIVYLLGILVLLLSVVNFLHLSDFIGTFICGLFILYSNYSIVMGVYWSDGLTPSLYNNINNPNFYIITLNCLFIFQMALFIFVDFKNTDKIKIQISDSQKENPLIAIGCMILVILVFVLGFSFGLEGERASVTPIFDYRIIFLVCGMIYSGNKRIYKYLWFIIVTITAIATMIGGNRADAMPTIIAFLSVYYNKFSKKTMYIGSLLAVFLFIMIGIVRGGSLLNGGGIEQAFSKLLTEKGTFDTAIWAYFPSLTVIAVMPLTSFSTKLYYFFGQLKYILLGGTNTKYLLGTYTKEFYFHVNGMVTPVYFYFWLGYFGVLLWGMYVSMLYNIPNRIKKIKKQSVKSMLVAIFLYFTSIVPRWYLYNPYAIVRGLLLLVLGMALCNGFNYLFKKS